MCWYKKSRLVNQGKFSSEIWIRETDKDYQEFPMDLILGKKTDLLALKKNVVERIKNNITYYNKSRLDLFTNHEMEVVEKCSVCGYTSNDAPIRVEIYNAKYVQCPNCTHVFLIKRPTLQTIQNFYLNDITYASTYTDKNSAEARVNAIAIPWVNFMTAVYEKKFRKKPRKILDVGSGAGHFVEACRRNGYQCEGIELSESSRDFARNIWGFEMDGRNFVDVADNYQGFDIVTFWGLLEHTPNPAEILRSAYNIVKKSIGGMIISKLPRWNSLSTAIQKLVPESVLRHLDPLGHLMAFTDASAGELYVKNGFNPIAAWYYGMDVYETFMQIGNRTDSYKHFTETGLLQTELQQFVDEARFSDGLTLVGVPNI